MRSGFILVVLVGLLPACSSTPPPPPAPEPTTGGEPAPVDELMWHHFWDAVRARDAVIEGRLEEVRAPLQRIGSGQPAAQFPLDWQRWVDEMQAQARAGAGAKDLAEAATAVAALGSTCGECHRATHGGPDVSADTGGTPPSGRGLQHKMHRHFWAAAQLWLGLTTPRHEAWARGAAALSSMPLPDEPLPQAEPATVASTGESAGGSLESELQEVRALGQRATDAAQPTQKAAVYAELLTRCAECHAQSGGQRAAQ